jgi:hypothetical protein
MESVLQRQVPRRLAAAVLVAAVALAAVVIKWRSDAASTSSTTSGSCWPTGCIS